MYQDDKICDKNNYSKKTYGDEIIFVSYTLIDTDIHTECSKISLQNKSLKVYIYIYICVCVCVCVRVYI